MKTSKKPILCGIDGNWFLHRVFNIVSQRETTDFGASLSYAFLAKVCVDAVAVKAQRLVIAFDGDSVFRYGIYPEYKGNRNAHEAVYSHLKTVRKLCASAGIPWIQYPKYEADDVLYSLSLMDDYDVVVCTKDKDAYQYLRPSVRMYDSTFKVKGLPAPRFVRHSDVESITGLPAALMNEYQILIGDGIDNVKGVMKPAQAKKGLLAYGSIKNWAANDPEVKALFIANKQSLSLNKKLVSLVRIPDIVIEPIPKGNYNSALPKSYYTLLDLVYPKSKGLF